MQVLATESMIVLGMLLGLRVQYNTQVNKSREERRKKFQNTRVITILVDLKYHGCMLLCFSSLCSFVLFFFPSVLHALLLFLCLGIVSYFLAHMKVMVNRVSLQE